MRQLGRYMLVFVVLVGVMGVLFTRLPSSFLPVEDQGYTITDIQLPPGASQNRTIEIAKQIEAHNAQEPGIANTVMILGFSFPGAGRTRRWRLPP